MKLLRSILSTALILALLLSSGLTAFASSADGFIIKDGVLIKYTGTNTDVVIPGNLGITEIGQSAFAMKKINSVTIPEGVAIIRESAFYSSAVTEISFSKTVTTIERDAFCNCKELKSVALPPNLTYLGDYAFDGCKNLAAVSVSDTPMHVGNFVFLWTAISQPVIVNAGKTLCYIPIGYSSYDIPNTVTEIVSAFAYCLTLQSVTIPSSVTYIGDYAFQDCFQLASVSIPDNVEDTGTCAFSGTDIQTTIYVNNGRTLCYVPPKTTSFTIPSTVTKIAGGAFYNCNISTIQIPQNVTYLGSYAFFRCSDLNRIDLNDNITFIGDCAFEGCGLKSFTIPPKVRRINNGTFNRCSNLTSMIIPSTVTSIGSGAFSYCDSLVSVQMQFGVTSIADQVFTECENLSLVTLPDSLCSIDFCAFSNCKNLRSLRIPDSVTELSDTALLGDYGLTVYGTAGSFLEQYAKNVGVQFVGLSAGNAAVPTNATVVINGKTVNFEAYNIGGSNYFKLRDIAMALDGTQKQFDVGWNPDKNAIRLTTATSYTPIGGELTVSGNSETLPAQLTNAGVFLDGDQIGFVAYHINGSNYFKVRNIGFYLDFSVIWDENTKTISIDTSKPYKE